MAAWTSGHQDRLSRMLVRDNGGGMEMKMVHQFDLHTIFS